MTRRALISIGPALVLSAVLSGWPSGVLAAFPGGNGKIAYESNLSGNFDVYTVSPDGSDDSALTNGTSADRFAAWSPDGTKLAFQSNRYGNFDVFVMNADGTGLLRLTSSPWNEIQPAWSPDGTRIVYAAIDPNTLTYDIWMMNAADGGGKVNVTQDPATDTSPAWSPDGREILFQTDRDGDFEIYSIRVGDPPSSAVNLSRSMAQDTDPCWAPAGDRIAFVSDRDEGLTRVWTMLPDGTFQEPLPGTEVGDRDPAWSPDGLTIAFSRLDAFGDEGIWTAGLDGSGPALVAAGGSTSRGPDWQPLAVQNENQAPLANAGPDGEAPCTSADGAMVHLDGSQSSDPDSTSGTNDDIAVFEWFLDYGTPSQASLGTGMTLDALVPVGTHVVTLLVTDTQGAMDTDEATWTVVDPAPPAISVSVSPVILWPPDHRLVPVRSQVEVTGGLCSPAAGFVLQSVQSSEADDAIGEGDGHTTGDVRGAEVGQPDVDVLLRAERMGSGPGRTYTLTYAIAGRSETTATATVFVPHGVAASIGAPLDPTVGGARKSR